jgi:PIN domain nuclease of toxin-antitoxin system
VSEYIADTHAFSWHLTGSDRLSSAARTVFVAADAGLHRVHIPSISLVEMVYLAERGRLSVEAVEELFVLPETPGASYAVPALDQATARTPRSVPRSAIPNMPDRIIVATAHRLGLPLITRDAAIRRSAVVPVTW